ncbi:MAG: DALR domain-containing protein, partial [Kordiimonas sp.]
FPHHENEIAQSECTHGKDFVKYWLHNGYLTVDGVKMSKSLGNFHTIRSLLEEHGGEPVRLSLLTAHYRQPVDFSHDNAKEQKRRLDRWYRLVEGVEPAAEVPNSIIEALADDLNTPKAIAELDGLASEETAADLLAGARFIGLLNMSTSDWFQGDDIEGITAEEIGVLIEKRLTARANKDFAESDRIRDELLSKGVALEDGPDGTKWRKAD